MVPGSSNIAIIETFGVPAGNGGDEVVFGQGVPAAINVTAEGRSNSQGIWTTTPPTCPQILTGAVGSAVLSGQSASTTGEPTTIQVTFAPNYGMTLQQAATACGFDSKVGASGFNWIQQKTDPAPSPFFAINLPGPGQPPGIPTNVVGDSFDPPPHGGYTYEYYDPQYPNSHRTGDFSYPFFCDKDSFIPGNHCAATTNTLSFRNSPVDNCFENADGTPSLSWATNNNGFGAIGPNGQITTVKLLCGGKTVPFVGSFTLFQTILVGILPGFVPGTPCLTLGTCVDLTRYGDFKFWFSTFNGTAGGDVAADEGPPIDPGSGSGGITVIQLPPVVPPSEVATTASGLAYSRVSQTFNGTVTLTNISGGAINGPLQILFTGMPDNVTLVNATGSLVGRIPYLTVPAGGSLAPGQSVTVSVQFKNPADATINFTPTICSGSIS